MSTPCLIAVQRPKGFGVVVCHSDGYTTYMGPMLTQHYSNRRKLEGLVANRDMSILRENVGRKHKHHEHYTGKLPWHLYPANVHRWTTFYQRDRGEPDSAMNKQYVGSFPALLREAEHWYNLYVYTLKGVWRFWTSNFSLNRVETVDDLPELNFTNIVRDNKKRVKPEYYLPNVAEMAIEFNVPEEKAAKYFPSVEAYREAVAKSEKLDAERVEWRQKEEEEYRTKTGRYAPERVAVHS
jgi:hypothetical protein